MVLKNAIGSGTATILGETVLAESLLGRLDRLGHGRARVQEPLDVRGQVAPLIRAELYVIHAGVTGLSLPGRRESLSVELSARFPHAQIRVSNDALISLWGGLAGQQGIAVLAGTGSIALARSADGREGRAGGWGYLLGDEGGGYWLGREAVVAYLRVLEGRVAASTLSDLVSGALGRQAQSAPQVIAWLHADQSQVTRLASLAPLVAQAADAGDPLARDILGRGAHALADLAASAVRQVWGKELPKALPIACCGGVWSAGPQLRTPFDAALAEKLPGALAERPLLPPLAGALLLAMDAATNPLPPTVVEHLKAAFHVESDTGHRGWGA